MAAGATATGAAANGDFAIQVVASSDKAKAESIAAPLKADGYNVTVASAAVSGKTVYRVSVGGFADKAAAEAAQVKMKSRYKQNQNVQSSFVVSNK
ncbi:MAG: SPOR domain-containing protein [Candidatus Thiothrix singaporensis]|uniref:SPOR domain-containing protein n=1 Tax=Candidatus Thiothrix singaporensis TaxID=2799669 RepID=A0A7L6AMV8_9GAMM|nr:MAG: SPOR domain-containing protein [Candidatus Thiothrix singaporensis]